VSTEAANEKLAAQSQQRQLPGKDRSGMHVAVRMAVPKMTGVKGSLN
jgi:hypothetical protein